MVRPRQMYTPVHTELLSINVSDDDFDSYHTFGRATGPMIHNICRGFYLGCSPNDGTLILWNEQ